MKASRSVEDLEKERMELFERYLRIEETLEEANRQKYEVCCGIERLNKEIQIALEERSKKEGKAEKSAPPKTA